MSEADEHGELCAKIARLVEERGWNREEFARVSRLSRLTIRGIFTGEPRKPHNATVAACADALGLTVHELRTLPLDKLLLRMRRDPHEGRRFEEATQPELQAWASAHPERAALMSAAEWDELLSLQGTGGPLTEHGVEHFAGLIERKRRLTAKVAAIAGTDQLELLEEFVEFLYHKIQPYHGRGLGDKPAKP